MSEEKEHGSIGQSTDRWSLHSWTVGQQCSLLGNKGQNQVGAFNLDLFGSANDYKFNTCAQWSLKPVGKHEPRQMPRVLLMSLHSSCIPEPSVTSPTTRSMLYQLASPGSVPSAVQSPCPVLLFPHTFVPSMLSLCSPPTSSSAHHWTCLGAPSKMQAYMKFGT